MTKYWFKPKRFGFGFFPISIEGWIATAVLLVLVIASGFANHVFMENGPTMSQAIRFVLDVILLAGLSSLFFEKKMKEPLRWRWSKKN